MVCSQTARLTVRRNDHPKPVIVVTVVGAGPAVATRRAAVAGIVVPRSAEDRAALGLGGVFRIKISCFREKVLVSVCSAALGTSEKKCRSYARQSVVYDARYQGIITIEYALHPVVVTVPQGRRQFCRTPSSLQDLTDSLMTRSPRLKPGAI